MTQNSEQEQMRERVERIRAGMAAAARAAGRDANEVQLCAACKTRTVETVRLSAQLPIDLFGENHVQELVEKTDAGAYLGKPGHFIGHLQTNKIKFVVGRAALIHSVDSLRLLEGIGKQAQKMGLVQDILLEINIGGEESKSGIRPEELPALLEAAAEQPGVHLRGLMAIPPAFENDAQNRGYFARMRRLLDDAAARRVEGVDMTILSMGMSDDYENAILEGSNLVRVGTAIYGPRFYPTKEPQAHLLG